MTTVDITLGTIPNKSNNLDNLTILKQTQLYCFGLGQLSDFINVSSSDKIIDIAKKHKLAFQLEVEGSGGSDAKELQMAENVWDWCFIGAGEQFVHTPNEKVHKKDIEGMIELYKVLMKDL